MNYIIYTLITFFILIHISCSTPKIATDKYKNTNTFISNNKSSKLSKVKIDNYTTYESFFILTSKEEKIKINTTANTMVSGPLEKEKPLRLFIIIEKGIFRKTKNSKKIIFSEISRNYNNNWFINRNLTIQSKKNDPIKQLQPAIYRIRLTTFSDNNFSYKIILSSNNNMKFYKSQPTINNFQNIIKELLIKEKK